MSAKARDEFNGWPELSPAKAPRLRGRGEKLERSFAHCYETGNMRRLHLRGRENIAKRVLVHAARFNIGLLMPVHYGLRKPRGLGRAVFALLWAVIEWVRSTAAIRGAIAIGEILAARWIEPRHGGRLVAA